MASYRQLNVFVKASAFCLVLALFAVGCTEKSETRVARGEAADSGKKDFVLAEHGIRLGMTNPEDGRTLVGVIDFSALPAAGIRIGSVSDEDPHCICVCRESGNTCTPAGCPDTCPVDLCSDGTFPPCNDGVSILPGLKGLLAQPIDPDGPPID